jgi:stage II sporulation protein M
MAKIPGPRQFARYLYDMRAFIGIVVALFLLSAAIGYMVPAASPEATSALLSGLQDKAESLSGQSPPAMMLGIFANNAVGSLMALLLGLIAGLFPLFFVASNGMVIGIMLEIVVEKLGAAGGATVFAAGILPHGVLELPAVLISTAIGLKLGYAALRTLLKGDGRVAAELKDGLLIFLFWLVPILFLAAFIETFVTGAILAYFVQAPLFK